MWGCWKFGQGGYAEKPPSAPGCVCCRAQPHFQEPQIHSPGKLCAFLAPLPSHRGSRVALPGGPRQRQDPGRGGMPSGWCGAAAAPPDRAKLLPGSRQPGLAFNRLSLQITAGDYRREGIPPCRPGGRGKPAVGTRRTGKAPASPANPGRGSPSLPASAAPAPKRAARKIKWWERCKAPWKG